MTMTSLNRTNMFCSLMLWRRLPSSCEKNWNLRIQWTTLINWASRLLQRTSCYLSSDITLASTTLALHQLSLSDELPNLKMTAELLIHYFFVSKYYIFYLYCSTYLKCLFCNLLFTEIFWAIRFSPLTLCRRLHKTSLMSYTNATFHVPTNVVYWLPSVI